MIEKAKKYAQLTGRSISELVGHYLDTLTNEDPKGEISPRLQSLVGAVKLPEDFDEDKELRNAHEAKHLSK